MDVEAGRESNGSLGKEQGTRKNGLDGVEFVTAGYVNKIRNENDIGNGKMCPVWDIPTQIFKLL